MKKLSLVIPVYNVEAYLRECLDSVLSQKNIEMEVILVNDGSTDGSKLILEEYVSNYSFSLINKMADWGMPATAVLPRHRVSILPFLTVTIFMRLTYCPN